jgi:hypothetical protein
MQSGLGHRVVWYMVMNVLGGLSGTVFIGRWKLKAVCLVRNLGTHQTTQSHNVEDCNCES